MMMSVNPKDFEIDLIFQNFNLANVLMRTKLKKKLNRKLTEEAKKGNLGSV